MAFHKSKKNIDKHYIGMKMRCYPSDVQKQIIEKNSNVSRFVYNEFVALGRKQMNINRAIRIATNAYHQTLNNWYLDRITELQALLHVVQQSSTVKYIQDNNAWMMDKQIDSLTKYTAKNMYDAAWNMYRQVSNAKIPTFHRKNKYEQRYTTMLVNQNIRFVNKNTIQMPKIGKIHVRGVRTSFLKDDLELVQATIHKTNDNKYYLSVQMRSKFVFKKKMRPKRNSAVGIDLNIENFYTDSDGNVVANPRFFEKQREEIANLNREYARRYRRAKTEHRSVTKAKNLERTRLKLAKAHKKIMSQRLNFTQNISTALIKNHDLVVAENLSSKNMMRNHALAMRIQDVGWRQLLGQLQYKSVMYNRKFVMVNPKLTTQTCSDCGFVWPRENRLTLRDREWTCPECGSFHIRDHNAAINILNKGLATLK